jgi:hypothetical protein
MSNGPENGAFRLILTTLPIPTPSCARERRAPFPPEMLTILTAVFDGISIEM